MHICNERLKFNFCIMEAGEADFCIFVQRADKNSSGNKPEQMFVYKRFLPEFCYNRREKRRQVDGGESWPS
ncbi:hypothetical protein GCM10010969_35920 [Saccharibacillus kuerlensis]|uniref:Uncharacterized protein n=1 Tax=Saccharibacillus kuerlensis TaxID=459527 RepID=A0ABQ2L9D4_9BACL|nr:hypothetical protein GCM10010969_35920 [Saccharibacillus kuerlensis]